MCWRSWVDERFEVVVSREGGLGLELDESQRRVLSSLDPSGILTARMGVCERLSHDIIGLTRRRLFQQSDGRGIVLVRARRRTI